MKPTKISHKGKGSKEEHLPSRFAMTQLTKGDPTQRSMSNYAKQTPGVGDASPSIMDASMGMGVNPYS